MKRMTNIFAFAAGSASALLTIAAGPAHADTKVIPSTTICQGGTAGNFSVSNPSFTKAIVVNCPIGRDRTDAVPVSIQVSVTDNSSLLTSDGNFACKALGVTRFGGHVSSGAAASTTGVNAAGTVLTLAIPAGPAEGFYIINCKIPRRGEADPASTIGSIRIVEADPTN